MDYPTPLFTTLIKPANMIELHELLRGALELYPIFPYGNTGSPLFRTPCHNGKRDEGTSKSNLSVRNL